MLLLMELIMPQDFSAFETNTKPPRDDKSGAVKLISTDFFNSKKSETSEKRLFSLLN